MVSNVGAEGLEILLRVLPQQRRFKPQLDIADGPRGGIWGEIFAHHKEIIANRATALTPVRKSQYEAGVDLDTESQIIQS